MKKDQKYIVEGAVKDKNAKPVPGLLIQAFDDDPTTPRDLLGTDITRTKGNYAITYTSAQFERTKESGGPDIIMVVYSPEGNRLYETKRLANGDTRTTIDITLDNYEQKSDGADTIYAVSGKVKTGTGLPLAAVEIEVYDKRINGAYIMGRAETDERGGYSLKFPASLLAGKRKPDLEVRVLKNAKVIYVTPVRYNAAAEEIIDITVDQQNVPRQTEYERIVAELQEHTEGLSFDDLENDEQILEKLTYLTNKTGWDPRMVGMLAQSIRLSATTGIDPAHYYAFYRAGIPGGAEAVARLSLQDVEGIIKAANENNIITATQDTIEDTKAKLGQLDPDILLNAPAVGISGLGDMLSLRLNDEEKNIFVKSYRESGHDAQQLWHALEENGLRKDKIEQLKLDGKLGYITGNNAPLMGRIMADFEVKSPEDLVRSGFYKVAAWEPYIGDDIPEALSKNEYAKSMTMHLQLSYPTLIVAEMINKNDLSLNGQQQAVHNFFNANHDKFVIGSQPVKTWDGFKDLPEAAQQEARAVERLYQMSPSNESMIALSGMSLTSAHAIAQYSQDQFLMKYSAEFPNETEAMLVHNKASEIQAAILNISTAYLTQQINPPIYSLDGTAEKIQQDIAASPSLEELFNNLDYCTCDHCKSVLSPAAYLVDMFQFIDLKDVPHELENPVEVLLDRRPDLEHILLSCENTNTILPYVDLVNEILEHYIVNGNLDNFAGFNVAEGTKTEDLLASPQFVDEAAYTEVKTKVYPYTLPFDQPLEALRLIVNAYELRLVDLLEKFGPKADAQKEWLGMSPGEYTIVTDLAAHALPEYFGEPAAANIDALNAAIANGKTFSRRVNIEYADLVAILKTQFINPANGIIKELTALPLSLAQMQDFYDGALTAAQVNDLLPAGFDTSAYNDDVPAWLLANQDLIMGMITLTEIGEDPAPCDFGAVELRYALPDNANNRLDELAYHKLHRFIRLWKKLGRDIGQTDEIIMLLLPVNPQDITMANIDNTFSTLLIRIANFLRLMDDLSLSEKKTDQLLVLWDTGKDLAYRREQLARLAKLSVEEVTDLAEITGIDPFAMDMEHDEPSLARFMKMVMALKAVSVKIRDLNYILRHKDESGELLPADETLLAFLRLIRSDLYAVDSEFQIAPDNADFSFVAGKMELVYDPAVVAAFMELLLGTRTFSAPLVIAEEALPEPLTGVNASLSYDGFKKELRFTGIMSDAARAALNLAADALTLADVEIIDQQPDLDDFITDFKDAVTALKNAGAAELASFGSEYPELLAAYNAVSTMPVPAEKASALLAAILPGLKIKRKVQTLQQSLTAILKNEPDVVTTLTESADVLTAISDNTRAISEDFLKLEEPMAFNANQVYDLYLDPFATDDYQLYVQAPENTDITLAVEGVNVIDAVTIDASGEAQNTQPVSFTAGSPAHVQLHVASLPAGQEVTLLWRTKGVAKAPVESRAILEGSNVDNAKTALVRLLKASQFQKVCKLTAREMAYLGAANAGTADMFNQLDTDGTIAAPALHALWEKVYRVLYVAYLKKEMEDEENTWVQILEDPMVQTPKGDSLLLGTADWKQADLDAVMLHFGLAMNDLSAIDTLKRVIEAMDSVTTIGFAAADVIPWSTNVPTVALVDDIKENIRERIDVRAWRDMIQSVNDVLRNKQRDALVSYILYHQKPEPLIDNANELFEYFLIDVQMDSCMQTSRIKQALSSVQLFINRCLMNLETRVDPSSIRAHQWAWMKRYRVWEANRQVFLYPENWLEPELRDNKSPFFRELEGELLQSDINTDLAEAAFHNYLKKLDDVARLEVTATFLQQNEQGNQDDDVLHVFGRTNGKTRIYYHRRFEYGYWTPWEKLGINVEADHIYPVVWKGRLFVFWLDILVTPKDVDKSKKPQDMADQGWGTNSKKNVEITMSWGEYYKGKWSSPKSSEPGDPVRINNLQYFNPNYILLYAQIQKPDEGGEWLVFDMFYLENPVTLSGNLTTSRIIYTTKNAPPIVENGETSFDFELNTMYDDLPLFNYSLYRSPYMSSSQLKKSLLRGNSLLTLDNKFEVTIKQPPKAKNDFETKTVLTKKDHLFKFFRLLPARYPVANQWEAPLFYSDERCVFFVQPDEEVKKVKDFTGIYDIGDTGQVIDWGTKFPPVEEVPVEIPPIGPEIDPLINPVVDPIGINANFTKILKSDLGFAFNGKEIGMNGGATF